MKIRRQDTPGKRSRFLFLALAVLIGIMAAWSQSVVAAESSVSEGSAAIKKSRPYPGGRDEEDLEVREQLPNPVLTVDRRSIEQRVLNSYFKKSGESATSQKSSE